MKTLVSKIVKLTMVLCGILKPCPSNPRQMRFVRALYNSYKSNGWASKEDALVGTVDRPVVTKSGRVVRGLARLGTIVLGLKGGDFEDDKSKSECIKFFREFVASGQVEICVIPDNVPLSVLRKISSDTDSLKVAWNRKECFVQWKALVEEDGVSPTTASMMVGFDSRRQVFEDLLIVDPEFLSAWMEYAGGVEGVRAVKDADVVKAAKLVREYRKDNPASKATDYGQEYREHTNNVLNGTPALVARLTATRQEIQEASSQIRTLTRTFAAVDVADMLLCLAGYKDNAILDPAKGQFSRYIRRIVSQDIAENKPDKSKSKSKSK